MKEFWDERYQQKEFAYGEEPNVFFKKQLADISPGKILFPAEGEGRNAVHAATLGWEVEAFDISIEGKNKAEQLAIKHHVSINYHVGDLLKMNFSPEQFDAIALIYAHFPASIKSIYHKQLDSLLRKDGLVILEAFSKKNLEYVAKNPRIGGPKDEAMLFSIEEIKVDFANYEVLLLEETEVELNEGLYHQGVGSVIRFVGRKK